MAKQVIAHASWNSAVWVAPARSAAEVRRTVPLRVSTSDPTGICACPDSGRNTREPRRRTRTTPRTTAVVTERPSTEGAWNPPSMAIDPERAIPMPVMKPSLTPLPSTFAPADGQ